MDNFPRVLGDAVLAISWIFGDISVISVKSHRFGMFKFTKKSKYLLKIQKIISFYFQYESGPKLKSGPNIRFVPHPESGQFGHVEFGHFGHFPYFFLLGACPSKIPLIALLQIAIGSNVHIFRV